MFEVTYAAFPLITKIYNIELTLSQTMPEFRTSQSPLIQIGIGTTRSLYKSMDKNLGFFYTSPFWNLIIMVFDVIHDGSCLQQAFSELMNTNNRFTASTTGIIPYITAYVNQDKGNQLTISFSNIAGEMDRLFHTVENLNKQASKEYDDTSTAINMFQLSSDMTTYTNSLKTNLKNLLAYWTQVESIINQLVPSILVNQQVFALVNSQIVANNPYQNTALTLYVRQERVFFTIYTSSINSVSDVIAYNTKYVDTLMGWFYNDDIVSSNWTSRQRAELNASVNICNDQISNLYLYM